MRRGFRDSGSRDSGRSRLLVGVLVLIAVLLLVLDYRGDSGGVRGAVNTITDPFQRAAGSVYSSISHSLSSVSSASRDRRRVEQLTTENNQLRRQLAGLQDAKRTEAGLSKLNLAAGAGGYQIVPARVIAAGAEAGFARTVTINAGSKQGIRTGLLVMTGDGLVGTTVRVTSGTTIVRLITDPESHIGARLESSQALGKVDGNGSGSLTFTLYDANMQLQAGQRLVTFGSLDYAAGVRIGTISKVTDTAAGGTGLTRQAQVRPYASLGSLDLLGVIVSKPPDQALSSRTAP